VSFVTDGYETRLRDLIRQSDDLLHLESRIPAILGQFLAQYGISTNRRNVDHPHQDQVNASSSLSGIPESSLEVESTIQPAFEHSNGSNDDNWLQYDDFVVSAERHVYSNWASDLDASNIIGTENDMFGSSNSNHDISNNMRIGNDMLSFAEIEEGLLGSTSASHSYEVLGGVL
jgi:hypothetical protein